MCFVTKDYNMKDVNIFIPSERNSALLTEVSCTLQVRDGKFGKLQDEQRKTKIKAHRDGA